METLLYSILHMLVDGLCALSMFAVFRSHEHWYLYLLIYNFTAFALQILFGLIMDILKALQKKGTIAALHLPAACSILGVLLTILGAMTHPALLGTGNAIFHVGGGIGSIEEDYRKNLRGQALGIFVAPGALGLYLGGVLGRNIDSVLYDKVAILTALIMVLLCLGLILQVRRQPLVLENVRTQQEKSASTRGKASLILAIALCFLVVVLRSYVGFHVSMSWKTGFIMGLVATLAVVLGKMLGGILSARFGMLPVTVISLLIAIVAYLNCNIAICGWMALLLFNMTMPITLYLITDQIKDCPGFSFGLLTLAIFLGWLPSWIGMESKIAGNLIGAGASLVTLIILACAILILSSSSISTKEDLIMKKISRTLLKSLLALALALELFILNRASVSADLISDPVEAATGMSSFTLFLILLIIVILASILWKIIRKLR